MPAARNSRTEAGGVFRMNVKVRSVYTVTSTGIIMPSGSFAVLALNCLQKSMMFTPCGPSAVPTGGAGVAFDAGNCNFTVDWIFLAIYLFSLTVSRAAFHSRKNREVALCDFFDLREI